MSMCFCEMDDGPRVIWESHPTARKEHICCECNSRISAGESYQLLKGIWDGDFMAYKTCSVCDRVRNDAMRDDGCICLGDLWETIGVKFE